MTPLHVAAGGGVPPVFVSRILFDARFDYVVTDDREAGRISAEHLLELGHRQIAALDGLPCSAA